MATKDDDYAGTALTETVPGDSSQYSLAGILKNLASGTSAALHGLSAGGGMLYDAARVPLNLLIGGANALGADLPPIRSARENVGGLLEAAGLPREGKPGWESNVIEGLGGVAGTAGPAAALKLGGATGPLVDALVSRPVVQLAGGVGQGVGQSLVTPETHPLVAGTLPIATSLLGSGVAGAGPAVGFLLGTRGAVDQLARKALVAGAENPNNAVTNIIRHQPDPANPMAPRMTTAEIAGDAGLLQTERTLRGGPSSEAGAFVTNDQRRAQMRQSIIDDLQDPGGPNAADTKAELERQQALRVGRAASADAAAQMQAQGGRPMTQLEADRVAAQTQLGAPATSTQTGTTLRDRLLALREQSANDVAGLRAAVDPQGTTNIDTRSVIQRINAAAEREWGPNPEARPGAVGDMLARLRGADPRTASTTFDELQNMRQALLRQSQQWGASADPSLGAVRAEAAGAIQDAIEAAGTSGRGFTPFQLDTWNRFRAAAAEHGRRFGTDAATDINASTYGRADLDVDKVMSQFFQSGESGGGGARAFHAAFARPDGSLDPAAVGALRQYVAGRLAPLAAPDGSVDSGVLTRFIRNHSTFLSQFPELQGDLRNVQTAQAAIERAQAPRAATVPEAADSAASLFLNRDPGDAVRGALQSSNRTQMLNSLRDQVATSDQATQGLRRGVLDDLSKTMQGTSPIGPTGDDVVQSQARTERWFRQNGQPLRDAGLFSRDELQRLQLLRDDLFSAQRVVTGGRAIGSNTVQNLTNGQVLDLMLQGQPIPGFVAPFAKTAADLATGNRFVQSLIRGRAEAARSRLYEAALDPEVAADLFRSASPETMDRLVGRMQGINWRGIGGRALPGAITTSQQAQAAATP